MDGLNSYLASIDWKAYVLLGIGIVLGALLKEVGKDLYHRISNKLFREHEQEKQVQIVVRPVHDVSEVASVDKVAVAVSAVERIVKLSYSEILKSVNMAPPMQRAGVCKNFVGIRVQWDASFYSGSEESDGKFKVWLKPGDVNLGLIVCEVSAADYPELKVLPEESPIRIIGNILKVEQTYIELTDVRLEVISE